MLRISTIILFTLSIYFLSSCSTTNRTTNTSRTAVEQLLISEAVNRSLPDRDKKSLPISSGSKVFLNTSGLTEDQSYVKEELTGWLGQQGYIVHKDENSATYRIDVIIGALGTESGGGFFGLPPIQSMYIPFSLPELALYKSQNQTGYVNLKMNIFERETGKFIASTPVFLADSYHNIYTILFLFTFTSTDLFSPPELNHLLSDILD